MRNKSNGNFDPKNFFENPEERFINRELSWLEFNIRVLQEAQNENHPILERVKFLSISANNLDEFYMVRVAGLKDQVRNRKEHVSQDGLTPIQQLGKIQEKVLTLIADQQETWRDLKNLLAQFGFIVASKAELTTADTKWLENYFVNNIFPAMSPIAVDVAHPFPFLPNLGLAFIMQLKSHSKKEKFKSVIPFPPKLSRFINIKGENKKFILVDDVIDLFKDKIYQDCSVTEFGVFHITRDSDLEIEEEAEDLVTHFESAVQKRRRGSVIALKVSASMPRNLCDFIIEQLKIDKNDIIEIKDMVDLRPLMELYQYAFPELKFEAYNIRFPERITEAQGNCFEAIAKKDLVVHHPYESFNVVVKFLQQAAQDPDVVAIKQTLYRTSSDSPIVKALIEAAEAGKSVTVVVELKARFDEEANIAWARGLERAGAQVVFGFFSYKTHAKISLVVRRESGELRSYVHFGTGNYHPITAKIYSDLSFFTCRQGFCRDAALIFNYLTGYSTPKRFEKISMSPLTLRRDLIRLINTEIKNAKNGKPAHIWAKLNSLIDSNIIDKLYEASNAGVKIELVVRGICGLRPGIPGLSSNIKVKSIVGRFLEHARIICFGNGHKLPSEKAKVFISSSDWMQRNLDRRIEIMVPIENPTVREQIMGQIMVANLMDEKNSWYMKSNGEYQRTEYKNDAFSAHGYFMTNPSLSGRGKALTEAESEKQKQKIYQLFDFKK